MRQAPGMDHGRWCEIPISHRLGTGLPSCEVAGRDSRQRGCENGFSHQRDTGGRLVNRGRRTPAE